MTMPDRPTLCIALIKPASELARRWDLAKPTYCIYEYDPAFSTREIRFGDGSWQSLSPQDHNDLWLIPQLDQRAIDQLFG